MDSKELEKFYTYRYENVLKSVASNLENWLKVELDGTPRVDRIAVRAKSISRFVSKALKLEEDGDLKYEEPLSQIQDQIGARIIMFYKSDIEPMSQIMSSLFAPIEETTVKQDSVNEFGYEGRHFIFMIPKDLVPVAPLEQYCPSFFELQIKTLFEHSWAEANHDLAYKPEKPLTFEQKRKIAFTAAQAWGADNIFDELFKESHKN